MSPSRLITNPRFYILAGSVAGSMLLASWLRLATSSDQLFVIRIEQLYGFISLAFWYVALIISPLGKALGKNPLIKRLNFMRRGIGVSAAYFALLHTSIAFWGQMGGFGGLAFLAPRFLVSIIMGAIALAILSAMALTSFDKIIKLMTFPRWKRLHQFGYAGGVLVLLHVWMIGTHVEYLSFRGILFVMLAILFGLEANRMASWILARRPHIDKKVLVVLVWVACMLATVALPNVVGSYRDTHATKAEELH